MYIKKQKELKTFLPTFIISFCRFNIRILSFGQFLSCASTILSFSELWRHFVLWSQSCDCDCDHRHCDHNPQNAIQAFMFSLAGIPLSLWSSAFHQLEVAGVTKRCQKSVQWHIFDSTEHIVTWQMWQCAIKWQSDMFSVKAVIIWIWLEIFIPHSPNFPPKVSWNTLGQKKKERSPIS